MNLIDITDMGDNQLNDLLDPDNKTFICPGCGCEEVKPDNYEFGMGCADCIAPDYPDYHDDSWGDHNPNYDY